ncbi:hypothetical protein D6D23_04377 [Aureobasidium pullulans]|nr:hypothetical protein D6D23_04377 [Aureobasidium pullulans]
MAFKIFRIYIAPLTHDNMEPRLSLDQQIEVYKKSPELFEKDRQKIARMVYDLVDGREKGHMPAVYEQRLKSQAVEKLSMIFNVGPLDTFDMSCYLAGYGILANDWRHAEVINSWLTFRTNLLLTKRQEIRLAIAHAYVFERAVAAVVNPGAINKLDREIRGLLLSKLVSKQEASAPSTGLLKTPAGYKNDMRQIYRNLDFSDQIAEFDTYPERVMDYSPLRKAWEDKARKLVNSGMVFNRRLDFQAFGNEFSPFRYSEARKSTPWMGKNIKPEQQSATDTAEDVQQSERAPTEAEIERKTAKNRKQNEKRKASKKAKKAQQQEEGTAEKSDTDSSIAELVKNFNLSTSETFHDSNMIPGMSSMTVNSYVRKPTCKGDTAQRDEVDKK